METRGHLEDMEASGVIATISRDVSVVSVNINGTDISLPFGRKSLYTWGNQCDGDMINILEEGMAVNILYRYTRSGDVPSAIAVWIGEKPDLSNGHVEALVDVYNQKGVVERILEDGSFTVQSDLACIVVVNVDIFFRDGCSQIDQQSITVGENVMFDAVPLVNGDDLSEAVYQATCAWVGCMPGLADRFGLHFADSSAQDLTVLTGDRVFGTIIVIPNDTVAFAYVDDAHEKVMLLRSSFNRKFERIQDAVEVGDRLCMRLRFAYIFSGCRQWFAERAFKYGEESQDTWVVQRTSPSACGLPANDPTCYSYDDEKENVLSNENSEVLYGDPPLKGTFKFVSKGKTKSLISYGKMNIAAKLQSLYVGDGSKEDKIRILVPNSVVNFEAVLRYPLGKKCKKVKVTHEAVCVWIDQKPTLAEFAKNWNLARIPNFPLPEGNPTFFGTVFQFYLPDIAVVNIKGNSFMVCLHTSALNIDCPRDEGKKNLISDFVRLGDSLSLNVTRHIECGDFWCATNVKILSKVSDKPLNVARFHNGFSRETNSESENGVSSTENEKDQLLPPDDESSNGMLCGNTSLPDVICGAIPKFVSIQDAAEMPQMQFNKTPTLFSSNSKVLWSDPPLTGTCHYLSVDKPIIVYKNLKILFTPHNFYIDGLHHGTVDDFVSLCKSKRAVKFEGTKAPLVNLNKCGIFHRTDLVWIGEKPSFSIVAQNLGSVDKEMLTVREKTFVGVVAKYYFPNMAVIKVKKGAVNSVVSLDTESFRVKPQCSSIKGLEILDFVGLQDKLEFKVQVKETCPMILRAYNARKLTKQEYDTQLRLCASEVE